MAAEQRYIRLDPKGLCRRYTVAGRTFMYDQNTRAPQWYTVSKALSALLEDEVHPANEKPIFEILTEAQWREVARHEVLAAMMLRGSVLSGALPTPVVARTPKSGAEEGKYEKHRGAPVGEVSAAAAIASEAAGEIAKGDDAGDGATAPDYASMTKAELIEAAEDLGIDLSDLGTRPTNDEIRASIEAANEG